MAYSDLGMVDVTGWEQKERDPRGKRPKVWVVNPSDGSSWLRKEVRLGRPYENRIEAFVLELARDSGIRSASGRACEWRDGGATHTGLVSLDFVGPGTELVSGASLMTEGIVAAVGRQIDRKVVYSPALVIAVFATLVPLAPSIDEEFMKVLAFDSWVGNGDRHYENWSILVRPQSPIVELAPMYDPAACLGSELLDSRVNALISDPKRLSAYVQNCPSGFGDEIARLLKMSEAVAQLVESECWRSNLATWLTDFRRALANLRQALDQGVQWLPEPRQNLALKLLELRLQWLEAFVRSE